MTAFRLTFDRNGDLVLEEDIGGVHPDECDACGIGWCSATDAAERLETLLPPAAKTERAA